MTEVLDAAAQNGAVALVPHAAEIVQQLRSLIGERELRLAELDREREKIHAELKVYAAAIKPLTGEAPIKKRGRPRGAEQPVRRDASRVGPERLAELKEFILAYGADHTEFRQVDIRAAMGQWSNGIKVTSSSTASAFEALKQEPENFLRIARVEGNSKFYRLTNSALRQQS